MPTEPSDPNKAAPPIVPFPDTLASPPPVYSNLLAEDVSWIARRMPAHVKAPIKKGLAFLAGGAIRSIISGEPINDWDLFVRSKGDARQAVLEVTTKRPSTNLVETENAHTIVFEPLVPSVQVVHRWMYQRPEDVLRSFDFTIASAIIYWDGAAEQWVGRCHRRFYKDLAAKRLMYMRPDREEEAGGSFLRMLKFYQRGYRAPLHEQAAVIARLMKGVRLSEQSGSRVLIGNTGLTDLKWDVGELEKVLSGLLREVDPAIDPTHSSH